MKKKNQSPCEVPPMSAPACLSISLFSFLGEPALARGTKRDLLPRRILGFSLNHLSLFIRVVKFFLVLTLTPDSTLLVRRL